MKVQCQICKDVFDDGTNPEGVLVPYIGLPQVTCPKCIIAKVIANHLSTVDVTTNEWEAAAKAAIKRADGYGFEPFLLMKTDKVPIKEMDEWCNQAREDYPCIFHTNVIDQRKP